MKPFCRSDRSSIFVLAIVVPKYLLINITLKMKRLYSNVGSLEAALQKGPEVLHAVDVNPTAHVTLGFVHELMDETPLHSLFVSYGIIGVDLGSVLHLLENFRLQNFAGHRSA